MSKFILGDCMDREKGIPSYPDNYFDLAIVDPPYGGGQHFNFRFGTGDEVYRNDKPHELYFNEIFRVSKNQIIWGANYFTDMLPPSRFWICWQKKQPLPTFSDFELAWGSFDRVSITCTLSHYGFNHSDVLDGEKKTIHPTQKPIRLYRWLLANYAKPGDLILDTHVGSASSLIAFEQEGFEYVGYELDEDYYNAANKRMEQVLAQTRLF